MYRGISCGRRMRQLSVGSSVVGIYEREPTVMRQPDLRISSSV